MKAIARVILSAIFLVLTAVLVAAAAYLPDLVFSFYPAFSRHIVSLLAGVTGALPFAVWEVLALLLILWAVYSLVRCFSRHRGFVTWLAGLLLGASAGILVFVAIWGLGHFGPSVGEQIGVEVREYSADELYDAAAYYTKLANTYAGEVSRTADGAMILPEFKELSKQSNTAYTELAGQYEIFAGAAAPVKKLLAAKLYSYTGTTGMFVAFTGESTVNPDTFGVSLPYTMCHEIAHRKAVPAEDDANFCAYLACMHSDSIALRYSGAYSAFLYCYNALYAADPGKAAEVWAMTSEPLRADCIAASAHYKPYEGAVQDAAQKVNDTYLKAFDEEQGVQSYGAVADYLIAWYLAGEQVPPPTA